MVMEYKNLTETMMVMPDHSCETTTFLIPAIINLLRPNVNTINTLTNISNHKYQMLEYNNILIIQARFACLRCAVCRHCVSADLSSGRLRILEKQYVAFLFYTKYARLSFVYGYINEIRTIAEILFRDKYNLLRIKS